jgi:hypothetical protein
MRVDHSLKGADAWRGLLVPAHEVELRLMLGWRLCDEPGCGNARMIPPASPTREARADG